MVQTDGGGVGGAGAETPPPGSISCPLWISWKETQSSAASLLPPTLNELEANLQSAKPDLASLKSLTFTLLLHDNYRSGPVLTFYRRPTSQYCPTPDFQT